MIDRAVRIVNRLGWLWLTWFAIYMAFGAFGLQAGRDSLFAGAVERVESPAVRVIFLNLPLQIVLAAASLLLANTRREGVHVVALLLGFLATGLMLAHVAIAIATW